LGPSFDGVLSLLALHLALGESRRTKLEKEKVTWNRLGRKTYTHKLRYELITVGKNEGALSVPLRRTGFMQKRSYGFFWTCRDLPSHRYRWEL
jgi:hypothetical protein